MDIKHLISKGVIQMKLKKELKEKTEQARNNEDVKKAIEETGMELTDGDLDQVSGGNGGAYFWYEKDPVR